MQRRIALVAASISLVALTVSADVLAQAPPLDGAANTSTATFYGQDVPLQTDSIIYVIDVSGSMNEGAVSFTDLDGHPTSGSRLDRAKVELIRSITALPEDDAFNIIAYDCDLRPWAPERQQASAVAKASATAWIGELQAQGATSTGPAVSLGLQEKNNFTVVLLSDGAPNCIGSGWGANQEPGASRSVIDRHFRIIVAGNTQRAVIHCFGIEAHGEFEQFLRDVASTSGGRYYPVP